MLAITTKKEDKIHIQISKQDVYLHKVTPENYIHGCWRINSTLAIKFVVPFSAIHYQKQTRRTIFFARRKVTDNMFVVSLITFFFTFQHNYLHDYLTTRLLVFSFTFFLLFVFAFSFLFFFSVPYFVLVFGW